MQQQDVVVKQPSKSYKSKIQAFIKHQQKEQRYKDMTCDMLLELFIKSEIQIQSGAYNSSLFDRFMKPAWEYQVSQNFLKKLIGKSQKVQAILSATLLILDGYFVQNNIKFQTTYIKVPRIEPFQSFFVLSSQDNYKILFEVGLHKQFIKFIKSNILEFEVKQKITIIDILFCCTQTEIVDCIMEYQRNILQNFSRTEFIISQLQLIQPNQKLQTQQKQHHLFSINYKIWPESLFTICKDHLLQYIPIQFLPIHYEKQDFLLDDISQQFISKKFYQIQIHRKLHETLGNENKYILKQYADFESAGLILDIIQKSPNFKIKLSQQEREIISTKNNALIIGRSGTGKTTSIVLRIFASEILLKVRSKVFGQKKIQLLLDQNGNKIVLHQILSTANSFLIQEIEKYYKKLLNIVQDAIEKHRANKTFNLDETFLSEAESEITNYENDVLDFVDENSETIQSQVSYDSNNNLSIKQVTSIKGLNFPSFLSTLNLLLLLDQRCQNPYFSQEKVIRLYNKHCRQAGFRDCNGVNLNEWFQDFIYSTQQSSYDSSSRQQNMQIIVPEVDFNIFLLNFWPNVAPRNRNIFDNLALPSLVWTQIYSFIKGSQYSYLYPNKYLPLSLYQERVQNFLTQTQIIEIYEYFLQYEEWKAKRDYYDQLDIVNSLLINIENKQIAQFSIHYSYIDEVQDLPQALIELYCKITEQGVIFSGDTAQSILKGVGFRFSDLQTLFRNSKQIGSNEIDKFQIFQLTMNFRSHNNILQFANVIIRIIELLFPQSIDHLQKEISNLQGPKPIIISENNPDQIHHYLNQQSQSEQQCEIEFGYNQVILVKNEQEKDSLPQSFQNFRILTVAQAKGLEFDDVIIYNFFTAEPLTDQQWQFLTCLDVNEQYIEHEIYEHKITKHKIEQDEMTNKKKIENKVKVYNLTLNDKYEAKKIVDFSSLCNELKLLYVCITRAKKRIIIYDDQPQRRQYLEKILDKQDVCEKSQHKNLNSPDESTRFIQNSKISNSNDEEYLKKWDEQGHAMYQRKLYNEAIKCFTKAQNYKMVQQSEAYYFATKGASELAIYQQINTQYLKNKTLDLRIELQQIKTNFTNSFEIAAMKFQNYPINDQIKAADCFYSGQNYSEALILYLNNNFYEKANKCAKKLKLRMLQILLNLKIGNIEKCLKYLNKYKIDEFFRYDLLKEGLENNYFTQSFIKDQLIILSKTGNNIFDQLLQKFQGQNNDFITFQEFSEQLCDSKLFEKLNLSDEFEQEINRILNSQIYIKDDLLEMIIVQIKVFWDIYYQILNEQMISNPFNQTELENSFNNKKYNQHFYDFIQEILEHFDQFNLLSIFLDQQKYFYKSYQQSNLIKTQEIKQNIRQVKSVENLQFMYDLKKNLQTFILHQILFKQSYQELIEVFRNHQNYTELFFILFGFENFQNNIICIQQQYHQFVRITNRYVDLFKNGKFYEFEKQFLQSFWNCNKCFEYFERIVDILFSIFEKKELLFKEDLHFLFDENDQIKNFGILYFLIQFEKDRIVIPKIFHNFQYWHYCKLFELLILGQSLFQIDEKIEIQKQIFYTICAIKGYYILVSKECNFIGINLIFKYNIKDRNYQFLQSGTVIKEIQSYFKSLFQVVLQEFFHSIIRSFMRGKSFLEENINYQKIMEYFLLSNLMEKQEKQVIQVIQIYFVLFPEIPQSISSFVEETKFFKNLNHYNKFKQCFESSEFSIDILQGWLNFYDNKNNQSKFQPLTLEVELEKVILVTLIQFQQYYSDNQITYKTINVCYLDFEKIIEQQNKEQKNHQKQNTQKDQQQENAQQNDKSQSKQQETNKFPINQDQNEQQDLNIVTNKCELIVTNQIEIGEKINEDMNEQTNKLSQESQQKYDQDGEIKQKSEDLEDELEKVLNQSHECQQDDFDQTIDEQFNDQPLVEIFDKQCLEPQQQNSDDQLEKDQQKESNFQTQNNIKQIDKIIQQEVISNENENLIDQQMQQKQEFEMSKRIILENDNEHQKYSLLNKEDNLQYEIEKDINIYDQNSVQQISKSNLENQQGNDPQPIIQSSLLSQEKQKDQIVPLLILTSQEKYLNQLSNASKEMIFFSDENLNQFYEFCKSLTKFLLKVILKQEKFFLKKILNKNKIVAQLFLLTYNITNQLPFSELAYQITQIFLEQKFQDSDLSNNLDLICKVLYSNAFHSNFSQNKQTIIDSTQFGLPKSKVIFNNLEDLQLIYSKQGLNYFRIRSTFINIEQKSQFQESLIYQKIYTLKNKLIELLNRKNQTYIQFKEHSHILQVISDIELEVDEQNNQTFQNQIVQQELEKKLDFWITKLLEKEDVARYTQSKGG